MYIPTMNSQVTKSATQFRFLSASIIAVSINVVLLFFLLFFSLLPLEQQRTKILELARVQADSRAQTAAVTMETALRGVDASIQSISKIILDTDSSGPELTPLLATLTSSLGTLVRGIFVVDDQGIITAQSSGLQPNEIINVSDRRYFRIHLENDQLELFIDEPLLSRRNNQWILLLSRAVRNEFGDLVSVVVVSLDPQRIQELLLGVHSLDQSFMRSETSELVANPFSSNLQLFLLQENKRIITQQPFDEQAIGSLYVAPTMEEFNINRYSQFPVYSRISLLPLTDMTIEVVFFPVDDLESWYNYRNNTLVILFIVITAMIVISVLVVNWISQREAFSLQLQNGIKEREALIREISHRTKNSLAIVSAMVQLKADSFPENDYVQQLAQETELRVSAMAQVYNHLDVSIVQGSIEIHEYILDLIDLMKTAYDDPTKSIDFNTQLDPVALSLDFAVPLSIVLHELLTNSYKHGFTNRNKGSITILLKQVNQHIHLEVSDDGVGITSINQETIHLGRKPSDESLGVSIVTQIIESQLNGNISFSNTSEGGYRVEIQFPLVHAPFIHKITE